MRDHILLTVVWLRVYPTHEVLGYLFVSDSTVSQLIGQVLPVLEKAGRDTMRMPGPRQETSSVMDDLLRETPELAVVIGLVLNSGFNVRVTVTRPMGCIRAKKKQHTLKSQVAVDEESGQVSGHCRECAGSHGGYSAVGGVAVDDPSAGRRGRHR